MDGGRVYSLFGDNSLDETHGCGQLTLSEIIDQKSTSTYSPNRKWKFIYINQQCFYLTPEKMSRPTSIDQHIPLNSIKKFDASHLYWLPGNLLFSTIVQMRNLEELSIKGTQVSSLLQVAKILKSCPKIIKLDFSYTEKTQEELLKALKKNNLSVISLANGFRKLTCLEMSTTALDCQNDVHQDPWLLIVKILTYCRDCTDLSVEVTYTGEHESHLDKGAQEEFRESIEKDWFPKLSWMKSLKSLVLVKLGPYATKNTGTRVRSRLLVSFLCGYLFPIDDPTPRPLQRIWIQDFEVNSCSPLQFATPEYLQSYRRGDSGNEERYEAFHNIEHLAGKMGINFSRQLPLLSKLKFATGQSYDSAEFYKFCELHPELEHVSIEFKLHISEVANDTLCKLSKLKSLSCVRDDVTKGFIEAMNEVYPNLETLQIKTSYIKTLSPDEGALPALNFPHLTSLSLCGFDLRDGASLLSVIKKCPKLEILYLDTDSLESTAFLSFFRLFLRRARNLREFRLKWSPKEDVYPETVLHILKTLLTESVQLERLVLIDAGLTKLPDWSPPPEFADFIVGFASKMTNLSCCCITYKQMDADMMKEIKQRLEEEVVAMRRSLWFHLGRAIPKASDVGVPPIHYHQIVEPISFVLPVDMNVTKQPGCDILVQLSQRNLYRLVIDVIFQYLNDKDIHNAELVSRDWKRAIAAGGYWKKRLMQKVCHSEAWKDMLTYAKKVKPDLLQRPDGYREAYFWIANSLTPKVTNVVSTVDLGCALNLEAICGAAYRYVEHTRFNSSKVVSLGLRGTSIQGRLFSSGKMVCIGARSDERSKQAARKLARIVQKTGYPRARFLDFQISNVTGTLDVKFRIRLIALKEALGDERCTYDECRPHVFYYRMENPRITLGIFHNGKVTLLGGKSSEHVFQACAIICPLLIQFRVTQ